MGIRRRPRHQEERQGTDRWLVSYADFITLLFAFFVVMYSVSSVNEGKYKVLSESLEGFFNSSPGALQPIPIAKSVAQRETVSPAQATAAPQAEPAGADVRPPVAAKRVNTGRSLENIAEALAREFDGLINHDLVTMEQNDQWVILSLQDSLLFGTGQAEPHYDAFPLLEAIAGVLSQHNNAVRVEGFTDNVPVRSGAFESNWELSAARAASVVRILAAEGVRPENLAAVGYGAFQPVARNDTEKGRKRNRRVVLMISRDNIVRGAPNLANG